MNEQTVIDAGQNFIAADPVLGSVIVVLMVVISGLFWWVRSILKEKDAIAQSHLDDIRKYASESADTRSVVAEARAAIAANTEQIRTNTEATRMLMEIFRERARP